MHQHTKPNTTVNAAATIQPQLQVNQPDDVYEREADRMAELVTSSSGPSVQRQCATCEKEETVQRQPLAQTITPLVQRQTPALEEEPLQRKCASCEKEEAVQRQEDQPTQPLVNPWTESRIQQSRGQGQAMDPHTRSHMENHFGADFSQVNIHTGSTAVQLSQQLNANAFTVGNDVYFNSGKYQPQSTQGQKLLAHELTHTLQQGGATQSLQKQDKTKKDTTPYTFGRKPHHHQPGKWKDVQKLAKANCGTTGVSPELQAIECICATHTPAQVMSWVLNSKMLGKPLATKHLNHYLAGSGKEYNENKNLEDLIKKDARVRQLVSFHIASGIKSKRYEGHFMIKQGHYDDDDFQYAFGGIDRVDWKVYPDIDYVELWFKDPYDFHPIYHGLYKNLGTGDSFPGGKKRSSNCVHAAGVELLKTKTKKTGAAIFIMKGKASFNLDVFDLKAKPVKPKGATDSDSEEQLETVE